MTENQNGRKENGNLFTTGVKLNIFRQFDRVAAAIMNSNFDEATQQLGLVGESAALYLNNLDLPGLSSEESSEFRALSGLIDSYLHKNGRDVSEQESQRHRELYDRWLPASVDEVLKGGDDVTS